MAQQKPDQSISIDQGDDGKVKKEGSIDQRTSGATASRGRKSGEKKGRVSQNDQNAGVNAKKSIDIHEADLVAQTSAP